MKVINNSEISSAHKEKIGWLKNILEEKALHFRNTSPFEAETQEGQPLWVFDIRNVLFEAEVLQTIAELFWEKYHNEDNCQVGGMETSAIPLITAIVLEGIKRGKKVSGFYVRKSRKKAGLFRQIEGALSDKPVILVDDLLHTGKSFVRQITLLEKEKIEITSIFSVVQFKKTESYREDISSQIRIDSLFKIYDFSKLHKHKIESGSGIHFELKHYFKSNHPAYIYAVPKSTPQVKEQAVYYPTDNGHVWCLNKKDLGKVWHQKLGLFTRQHIFTSPVFFKKNIAITTYNGLLYILDTHKGSVVHRESLAEKITTSPLQLENETLLIGTQNNTNGSIVCYDAEAKNILWEAQTNSPIVGDGILFNKDNFMYCDSGGTFYIGDKNGVTKKKEIKTTKEIVSGLTLFDEGSKIAWSSMSGEVFTATVAMENVKKVFQADAGIYSRPYIIEGRAYFSSLDKNIYCIDLKNKELIWQFSTKGRVFASPVVHNNVVYVGSNDARVYALHAETGRELGFYQTTERITSPVTLLDTGELLVSTFANELYLLSVTRK